jgi:anaerobic selenocysteine-containing dehydrogenase
MLAAPHLTVDPGRYQPVGNGAKLRPRSHHRVALSLEQYRARNPAGRAILKPAEYRPPAEEPDDVYPFLLTTGHDETFRHDGDDKDLRCRLSFCCRSASAR